MYFISTMESLCYNIVRRIPTSSAAGEKEPRVFFFALTGDCECDITKQWRRFSLFCLRSTPGRGGPFFRLREMKGEGTPWSSQANSESGSKELGCWWGDEISMVELAGLFCGEMTKHRGIQHGFQSKLRGVAITYYVADSEDLPDEYRQENETWKFSHMFPVYLMIVLVSALYTCSVSHGCACSLSSVRVVRLPLAPS